MAIKGTEVLTYADWAARNDKDRVAAIIEVLNKSNEILTDMPVLPANDGTGHKTTVRTGLPQATWRMLNYGVPRAKSRVASVRDSLGMLEVYAEVDKMLADLNGNTAEFRLSESKAFLEGMNQQMAETVFYGNTQVYPERFTGFSPRYNTLSASVATSENVIDAGGTGSDNTSIWLIYWGENTVHGIYPKGSKQGLIHTDKGQQTLVDENGDQFEGYRDHFKWDLGLTVRDWRFCVRIANIDVSLLTTDADYLKDMIGFMIAAEERIPHEGEGRPVWYGNKNTRTALRLAALEKIANNVTMETLYGKKVTAVDGIPFRKTDAILNTEARIVA